LYNRFTQRTSTGSGKIRDICCTIEVFEYNSKLHAATRDILTENLKLPFAKSYWVIPGKLLAGQYPGHLQPELASARIHALYDCGIRHVINLMEAEEVDSQGRPFVPYLEPLRTAAAPSGETIGWNRYPIRDGGIPEPAAMTAILDDIDRALENDRGVYVHCWGGKGRTGTVIGCYLIRHGLASKDIAIQTIRELRQGIQPYEDSPETSQQRSFVQAWEKGQ
jgi:hypothetical protein